METCGRVCGMALYQELHRQRNPMSALLQGGHLGVEPPDHDLVRLEALLRHDLQEGNAVAVIAAVHLAHDGEEVPHALGLAAAQGAQEGAPLGGRRRRRSGEVVDVAEHDGRGNAELDEYLLDVFLEVF